jgi:hypothetical protein
MHASRKIFRNRYTAELSFSFPSSAATKPNMPAGWFATDERRAKDVSEDPTGYLYTVYRNDYTEEMLTDWPQSPAQKPKLGKGWVEVTDAKMKLSRDKTGRLVYRNTYTAQLFQRSQTTKFPTQPAERLPNGWVLDDCRDSNGNPVYRNNRSNECQLALPRAQAKPLAEGKIAETDMQTMVTTYTHGRTYKAGCYATVTKCKLSTKNSPVEAEKLRKEMEMRFEEHDDSTGILDALEETKKGQHGEKD